MIDSASIFFLSSLFAYFLRQEILNQFFSFLRPKGKKPPSSSACIPPSMIHYRVESDYSLSVLLSSIVCLLLARSVHLEGTKKARGFTILVDWNPTLDQKLFMVGSFLVPIAYRPVLQMTCCAIIVAGWSVATSLPLCSVRYELHVLCCFRFYLTTWRRMDRLGFRNKRMTDGPCHSLEFRASARWRWRLSLKRPNKSFDPTMHHRSSSFWVSICLSVLLHCFYRPSQSTVSFIQWCRLSLISLGTTTMKFAFQTVLFLSSSFAFVKGQTTVCMSWHCSDPATTTDLNFSFDFIGTIPTEIGLFSQLERLVFSTCFGVFGSFLVPLSTCLTTHVWLNCASPRYDRNEWRVDRKHPVRDRAS